MARDAAWQTRVLPDDVPDGEIAALVAAGNKLFAAGSNGSLTVLSADDGRRLSNSLTSRTSRLGSNARTPLFPTLGPTNQ